MKEINNLTYGVQIGYVNKLGEDVAIAVEMHDNGLVINSVQIGSVCVTEETIGGRVLSGRFENEEGFCGYRYDYENFFHMGYFIFFRLLCSFSKFSMKCNSTGDSSYIER